LNSPASSTDRIFRFGPFELSEREGELRKNGVRIKVQEQPFRILLELVTNAGRTVTREELQQKLWLAETFVDFDVSLNTAIRKLRQALGDDAEKPRYIETQARRGYRFIASVTDSATVAAATAAPAAETMTVLDPRLVTPVAEITPVVSQPMITPVTETSAVLPPITQESSKPGPSRKWVWLGVAACIIAVATTAAWWWKSHRPNARQTSVVEINPLTETGNVISSAVSRDGSYIAYVPVDGGKYDLRLLQVATGRVVQILPPSELAIIKLHFSPDGNFIYLLRQLEENSDALGIFRIATLGGPATPLATDAQGRSLTVSPDGNEIAYVAQTTVESFIVAIDSQGGNRRVLAKRPLALGFRFIEWSPSPDKMAAVVSVPGTMAIGLTSIDLRRGDIRDLSVTGWGTIGQPAWSPDSGQIYAGAVPVGQLSAMTHIWAFDARTGNHKALTSGSTQYRMDNLSATAAGDLVALTKAPFLTLWVTDTAGQPQQIPSTRSEGWNGLAWVGNRIVTDTLFEMIVHDSDGKGSTKLTGDSAIYRELARCGSGRVAYWAADAKSQSHIARTDISTGATEHLTGGPLDVQPTCTPDGSTVIFVRCAVEGNRCYLTSKLLSSGQLLDLHELNLVAVNPSPTVSPDGARLIFMKQDKTGDPPELVMTNPVTGGDLKTLKLPVNAADMGAFKWSPDGKSILYSREDGGVGNIWSVPIEGQPATKLTDFKSGQILSFDVSSDNRLAISRGAMTSDIVIIRTAK
jgi:DNA-binding winged helix-turn-helix (wHTH) protein/Tol biopolymer transport system component